MKKLIVGRKREMEQLEKLYASPQSEFVVVFGRCRVGKTYLVRELFEGRMAFHHTALSPFEMEAYGQRELLLHQQLAVFGQSLRDYGDYHDVPPKDWLQAFQWLKDFLSSKPKSRRLVVFLDELPWMDTPRSGFVTAFEHFWNGWGAGQRNLMLVVCGSATSWVNDKLINSTGGMYGRTTCEIHLSPFSLGECKQFFERNNCPMNDYDVIQTYMVMGGIPYYLAYIDNGMSLPQNIDFLFFSKKGKLRQEFNRLFKSLFVNPQKYIDVLRFLSKRKGGYTRKEIAEALGMASGGGLSDLLQSLEVCDFIMRYVPFGCSARHTHFKLTDMFCLFYFHFVEAKTKFSTAFWQENFSAPTVNAWRGLAFEEICFVHQNKLKEALGIKGVHTEVSAWRNNDVDDHTQIDMVIDRNDRVINLCEMKFCSDDFVIDKSYERELRHKVSVFVNQTKTKKTTRLTLVTPYGLKHNMYTGIISNVITMDSLF